MDLHRTWGGWKIKLIVACYMLLSYSDFHKWFDINTNAIKQQVGAVIIQEGKPISFLAKMLKVLRPGKIELKRNEVGL